MYKSLTIACFYLFITVPILAIENKLPTYFSYSAQDIAALRRFNSDQFITKKDLQKWDKIVAEATKNEAASSLTLFRFYTYFYVAQAEASFLSYHIKGKWMGSLDPLLSTIFTLFYPEFRLPSNLVNDAYSNALAKIVSEKIRDRIEKEDSQASKFAVPKEKESIYVVGLSIAQWIPWYAKPIDHFRPPPPPPPQDPFWKKQVKEIEMAQTSLTEKKKEIINFWAGLSGPESSDWRIIANHYLFTHDIPLSTSLQVRALLMMGLYDGMIVGFDAKYHYLTMRPQEYDPAVHYEITVPKHPSYPANHALLAAIAATILSSFFPTEAAHWGELGDQAGQSRIWAGIHYPIDVTIGTKVGQKIGKHILEANK